jgi:hypothetical protein
MYSDEFGDYAGEEQKTIRSMMEHCVNCDDEWAEEDVACPPEWRIEDRKSCRDLGHEKLLTEADLEWAVCGTCRGKRTSSLYLGSFSSEELWEDPDFAEEYLDGAYDRPCPECDGRTTVRQISEHAKHRERIDEWFQGMHELRAEEMAERRMGA